MYSLLPKGLYIRVSFLCVISQQKANGGTEMELKQELKGIEMRHIEWLFFEQIKQLTLKEVAP